MARVVGIVDADIARIGNVGHDGAGQSRWNPNEY